MAKKDNTKKIIDGGIDKLPRYHINMGGKRTLVRETRSGTKVYGETWDWLGDQGWGQTVARESDKRLKQLVAPHLKQTRYVSSYLDMSVNKPGKYGIDY